jgi:hypothetical protein
MTRTACRPSSGGFTLVELLVAMGLMSAMTAALVIVLRPALDFLAVQPEAADTAQRSRFAWTAVRRDLEFAGAGSSRHDLAGALHRYAAPVMPYRIGERRADPVRGVFYRSDAVTLLSVPSAAVPARVTSLATAPAAVLVTVDTNCSSASGVCGFEAGVRVAVFDHAGRLFYGTVESVDQRVLAISGAVLDPGLDVAGGAVITAIDMAVYEVVSDRASSVSRLTRYDGAASDMPVAEHVVNLAFSYAGDPRPPALMPAQVTSEGGFLATYGPAPPPVDVDRVHDTWPAGENCTFAVVSGTQVSRLATLGPGDALIPLPAAMLTDGPWCPDAASPHRFDADLLRIRRVSAVLRVQASMPWFRGSDPALFANPGTGRSAAWLVPDQQLRLAVTPRNMRAFDER